MGVGPVVCSLRDREVAHVMSQTDSRRILVLAQGSRGDVLPVLWVLRLATCGMRMQGVRWVMITHAVHRDCCESVLRDSLAEGIVELRCLKTVPVGINNLDSFLDRDELADTVLQCFGEGQRVCAVWANMFALEGAIVAARLHVSCTLLHPAAPTCDPNRMQAVIRADKARTPAHEQMSDWEYHWLWPTLTSDFDDFRDRLHSLPCSPHPDCHSSQYLQVVFVQSVVWHRHSADAESPSPSLVTGYVDPHVYPNPDTLSTSLNNNLNQLLLWITVNSDAHRRVVCVDFGSMTEVHVSTYDTQLIDDLLRPLCRRLACALLVLAHGCPRLIKRYAVETAEDLCCYASDVSPLSVCDLYRRCALVIHHGGIGTTQTLLLCGIPQVLCPVLYDQWTNAQILSRISQDFVQLDLESLWDSCEGLVFPSTIDEDVGRLLSPSTRLRCGCRGKQLRDCETIAREQSMTQLIELLQQSVQQL